MGEFDSREQGFEAKFAHDQELMFKAKARRDALAARWVVGQLGLTGAEAEAYLQSLVALTVQKDHERVIAQKILADFAKANLPMTEHRLAKQMAEFLEQAVAQIKSDTRG
jgi:hypothetical protein